MCQESVSLALLVKVKAKIALPFLSASDLAAGAVREAAIRSKAGEEGKFSVSMGWLERWLAGRGGEQRGKTRCE